jgi:ATP-dependent helicase/nuclease subunit A
MRLLYVALTRARSWLIVAGAGKPPKPGDDAWYTLVQEAIDGLGAGPGPDGEKLVLARNWRDTVAAAAAAPGPGADWTPAPGATAPAPATLSPSGLGGGHVLPGTEADAEATRRGEALHRLLEVLHPLPPAARAQAAARLLPDWPDPADLLAEATAVLGAPALAHVFALGTLAEVDATAPLAALGGARILGRIDRLVIGAAEVLAVDFKSNRAVPDRPEEVPEGILRQMGAYRAALAGVWPDRRVATAILWTRTATLMALPDALVDAALARARP